MFDPPPISSPGRRKARAKARRDWLYFLLSLALFVLAIALYCMLATWSAHAAGALPSSIGGPDVRVAQECVGGDR